MKDKLKEILLPNDYYSDPYIQVTEIKNGFELKVGAQYHSPEINFKTLFQLSELFGTQDIDVDDYANSGCESCDWGSDYGHTIQIRFPTKLTEELKSLIGEDLCKP